MKNKGELLIETLLSSIFLSLSVMYLTKNIQDGINITRKDTDHIIIENEKQNLIEYVKSVSYTRISKMNSKYNLLSELRLAKKYFTKLKKFNLEIEKTNMYLQIDDKKMYIYRIKAGDIYDYYIPK